MIRILEMTECFLLRKSKYLFFYRQCKRDNLLNNCFFYIYYLTGRGIGGIGVGLFWKEFVILCLKLELGIGVPFNIYNVFKTNSMCADIIHM